MTFLAPNCGVRFLNLSFKSNPLNDKIGWSCFQYYKKIIIPILFSVFLSIPVLAQVDPHKNIIDSLNQLAWDLVASDPQRATRLVEQTLKQTEEIIDYPEGKAFCLNTFGVLSQNSGEYDKALQYYNAALDIRLKQADSSLIASTYHNLASLKEMMGDCGLAFDYAIKAIRIWEQEKKEKQLGIAYNTFATIHECNGNYEDAIAYAQKSLKKLWNTNDWAAMADAEYNLGRRFYLLAYETDDAFFYDSALIHYQKALELFENKVDDKSGHAWTLNGMGLTSMNDGNLEMAENYFYDAIEKVNEVGDSLGLFDLYCNLSLLNEMNENFDKALEFTQAAEKILADKGSEEDRQYLYEQYAYIYEQLGDYKKAYQNLELSDSLKAIFLNEDMSAQMAQKEAEYKTNLLQQESETQRIKAQKSRLARNVFGIVAGLLLVILCLGAYLVEQRRKSVNAEHQQAIDELMERQERKFMDAYFEGQEEEKKKFSDQLHTHLGSLLVAAKWDYDGILEDMEKNGSDWAKQLRLANTKLHNVYQEVRQQSHDFGTSRLKKMGLIAALKDLCHTISASGRIKASFNSFGLQKRLDPKIEIGVYRIIQELVSNTLKHAKAKHLNVQINPINSDLSIIVEDDGIGFDYKKALVKGIGLTDIKARAESLEGKVIFDTNKGAGTTVIVDIPLKLSSMTIEDNPKEPS